jgi:soluble lytic murein transglycosylase-like protein
MTLQRIEEIRSRFEPAATPTAPDNAFEAVLSEAMSQQPGGNASANLGTGIPADLNALIQEQAATQGLDPNLLKAVIRTESNFNSHAQSSAGAQGLMQLMPGTAHELGVSNSFDPAQNIAGGAKYLKTLMSKYQSVPTALAAYNAGPGAVDRHHGIPPYAETTRYVDKVMNSYKAYQNAARISVAGGLE